MDTITRASRTHLGTRGAIFDFILRAVCHRRGHLWRLYGELKHGRREYCSRCRSNRVTFHDDGETVECTAPELLAGSTRFAEALYEARWGAPPRQKMRAGEWPAP